MMTNVHVKVTDIQKVLICTHRQEAKQRDRARERERERVGRERNNEIPFSLKEIVSFLFYVCSSSASTIVCCLFFP